MNRFVTGKVILFALAAEIKMREWSVILVLMGIFPQVFYWISELLGFQAPINMVYLVIIFVLIVKLFLTSVQISQLENKVDSLNTAGCD